MLADGAALTCSLSSGELLAPADWRRALLATELAFASDLVGSAVDWPTTTGFTPSSCCAASNASFHAWLDPRNAFRSPAAAAMARQRGSEIVEKRHVSRSLIVAMLRVFGVVAAGRAGRGGGGGGAGPPSP